MARTAPLRHASEVLESLPELLRTARESRGMSYRDAGAAIGIPYTVVRNIELGLVDPRASSVSLVIAWLNT